MHADRACLGLPLFRVFRVSSSVSIDLFLEEEEEGELTSCGPEVDDEAEQDDRECGEVEPERLVMLYQIGRISVIEQEMVTQNIRV